MGESQHDALPVLFDPSVKMKFHGAKVTCEAERSRCRIHTPYGGKKSSIILMFGMLGLFILNMNASFALGVGDWVIVANTKTVGLTVRTTPGGDSTGTSEMDGTIGYIVDHPNQPSYAHLGSGTLTYTWWYISWADGHSTEGWSAEKFTSTVFLQRDSGTLTINSSPVSGASFSITGPKNPLTGKTYSYSGKTPYSTSGLQGSYTVTWSNMSGYTAPAKQTQSLPADGQSTFTGTYTAIPTPTPTPKPKNAVIGWEYYDLLMPEVKIKQPPVQPGGRAKAAQPARR